MNLPAPLRVCRPDSLARIYFEKDTMATANMSDPSTMTGADVYDGNGRPVGKIDDQVEVEPAAGERGPRDTNTS
jgi:hypothetical protein